MSNGVFALEHSGHNVAGGHEFDKFSEKGTLFVNSVEIRSAFFGQPRHLQFANGKFLGF